MFIAFRGLLLTFVLLAASLPGLARDPVQVQLPATPDGTLNAVVAAFAEGKTEVLWQALPASYQADIKKLLVEFTKKMDAEIWAEAIKFAGKVSKLSTDKTDLVIGSQLVAHQLQINGVKPEDAKLVLTAVGGMLVPLQTHAATLPQVEKLDAEKLLADFGPSYLEFTKAVMRFGKLPPGKSFDDLFKLEIRVVSSTADSATVEVTKADSTKEMLELVRVEGKWIPQAMADSWPGILDKVRKKFDGLQLKPEQKQQGLGFLNMVNGILDGFLNAKTQQEFDASIATVMPLIQQAMPKNLGGPVEIRQQKSQQ